MTNDAANPPPEGSHHHHELKVGDAKLNFRAVMLADPAPTGREILAAVDAKPVEDFAILAVVGNGELVGLGLDERFDLRGRGVEKVLVFSTDRLFRFSLDHKDSEWGAPLISGRVLKTLAGVDVRTHDVYQEVRGADDLLIRDDDLVDLAAPGVERFFTAIAQTTEGLSALLPPRDVAYLDAHGFAYEDVAEGGTRGVILKSFPLPEGRFTAKAADVFLMLPPGYPDCPVDMFYTLPWLKLTATGADPRACSVPLGLRGQTWQRWSRHNYEWRPGIDGLHTMVKRVERALAEAA